MSRGAWFVIVSTLASAAWSGAGQEPPEPIDSGLVETAATRLVQIEVSVSGPPEVITRLVPADFLVKVKRPLFGPLAATTQIIEEFKLDPLCRAEPRETADGVSEPAVTALPRPVTYLLYFDQPHLTLTGRQRALDLARELVERLVVGGSRAMVLSNAGRVEIVEDLTADAAKLRAGLARLEGDLQQFDVFAENEGHRVGEIARRLDDGLGLGALMGTARNYQFEEVYRADRSLRRLRLALSRFAELTTSKVVLYFADTMRSNAGEHYTSFFGEAVLATAAAQPLTTGNLQAQLSFDKLINEAAAHGIRFYPVLARGLVSHFEAAPTLFSGSLLSLNSTRQRHAEKTLHDLAAETGGHAFVHGEPAARIARRIHEDHTCLYVVSFQAEQIPLDAALSIVLEPRRDDIVIRSQGRLVVQSDSRRTATRLLSGFLFESHAEGGSELAVRLVPTDYRDGAYQALLQLVVPGTTLPASSWDLGASLVFHDRVRGQVSGRIELRGPGVPAVFESEVTLRPGPYEIVAVAHETRSQVLLSEHLQVDLPDPDARPGTLLPVALLQPFVAAFSREGVTRTVGALARAELEPLDVDRPLALLGLVCRGRSQKGRWLVERSVVGHSRLVFPPLEIELDQERCFQIRDLIPAGSLGPGIYRYETRLVLGDASFTEAARQFQTQQADSGL